jgi:hypothetical protein
VDLGDEYTFHQSQAHLNPYWILLDNQSTTDIFCNKALLGNVRDSDKSILVHCNAGNRRVSQVGILKNYGEVWYNKFAIATILSLLKVKEWYPVKYDTTSGNTFIFIHPTKEVIFEQIPLGLYYHDTKNHTIVMTTKDGGIETAKENREGYIQREYERAKQARRALGMVGHTSPKDFHNMVYSNKIHNCPVAPSGVKAANNIFGPDIASLRVKTVQVIPSPVTTQYMSIPPQIIELNKDVTLTADIMFVNKLPFMISMARKSPRQTKPMLIKSLEKFFHIDTYRGFKVSTTLMDGDVKLLPLPQLHSCTRTYAEKYPTAQRSTQLRSVLDRVCSVSRQNLNTTTDL